MATKLRVAFVWNVYRSITDCFRYCCWNVFFVDTCGVAGPVSIANVTDKVEWTRVA